MTIRVLLADDQALRLGFRMVLETPPDLEVVGEAAQAATMTGALEPDVVLMDVPPGGLISGIRAGAAGDAVVAPSVTMR